MKMTEAEKEALCLCPNTTVFLTYDRAHIMYKHQNTPERGLCITCSIWVAALGKHFQGPNWESAVMQLRNALQVNAPQPCPDEETEALPA